MFITKFINIFIKTKFEANITYSRSKEVLWVIPNNYVNNSGRSLSKLTKNFFSKGKNNVWMSHADQVTKLPKNFKIIAQSINSKMCIIENVEKKMFGIQFHPEVNLRMHLAWLYFAGYRLSERGAQTRKEQLTLRLKYGKNITIFISEYLWFLNYHIL